MTRLIFKENNNNSKCKMMSYPIMIFQIGLKNIHPTFFNAQKSLTENDSKVGSYIFFWGVLQKLC